MPNPVAQSKPKKPRSKAKPRKEKLSPLAKKAKARMPKSALPSLFVRALEITNEEGAEMLRRMYRIRRFEETVFELASEAKITGSAQLYSGQEAVAVGACSIMRDDDYMTSTHRGHGHFIAHGGATKAMLAELAGRATGYCRGKGGSMHLADPRAGNLGATGIVGGNIPVAVGAALACKLEKREQAVICFFGDGAANNGAFHESLNLAAIWDLPVVFICENNHFALSFPAKKGFKAGNIFSRAQSYGMEGVSCDGMHVLEVREMVGAALRRARDGKGPTLIEAVTFRYERPDGRARGDASTERAEALKARDPIDLFRIILAEADAVSPEAADAIEEEISEELKTAVTFALEQSPYPNVTEVLKDVYKGWIESPLGLVKE